MVEFDPEFLKSRFAAYFDFKNYKNLKQQCESKVVQWKWANKEMVSFEPFEKEIYSELDGKWIPKVKEMGDLKHGLDSEGKVLVIVDPWFCGERKEDLIYETFYTYSLDKIEVVRFGVSAEKDPDLILEYEFLAEKIIRKYVFQSQGGQEVHYLWDKEVLIRSLNFAWNHDLFMPPSSPWKGIENSWGSQTSFEYEKSGIIKQISRQGLVEGKLTGEIEIEYKKKSKEESLTSLSNLIEKWLLEHIPKKIKKQQITQTVYCLLLSYNSEAFEYPPDLALGTEKERENLLKKESEEAKYNMWIADEFELPWISCNEAKINELFKRLYQLTPIDIDFNPSVKILRKVAKKLMKIDWDGILTKSNDFVIFPCDVEGDDMIENLKKSVSPANFKLLKSSNFIDA